MELDGDRWTREFSAQAMVTIFLPVELRTLLILLLDSLELLVEHNFTEPTILFKFSNRIGCDDARLISYPGI
jgi:hypothetical protein